MMVNLEQLYEKIDTKLSDNRPKEDKLHQKAQERLSVLYSEQSDSLDKIIAEVDRSLNMDDLDYTYKLIKKLSKNLNSNRQQLLLILKEVL
jgi:hypothetical protein